MSRHVAISIAAGDDLEAPLEPRFGRAPHFLVVDESSGHVVAILDNPAADSAHGAGAGAATLLGRRGVSAVVSGRFGPHAQAALQAAGIDMLVAPEGITARQALAAYRAGILRAAGPKTC